MTKVHKLRAVGAAALLALGAAVTAEIVWGDSGPQRGRRDRDTTALASSVKVGAAADLTGKFSNQPLVTYQTGDGEVYFALQLQPKLDAPPRLPRDLLVMVDTSANQAGGSYVTARGLTAAVANAARAGDRVAVWTVNTPAATRDLTGGFQAPGNDRLQAALTYLEKTEYASGATDLKNGLAKALQQFGRLDPTGRQRVLLFLGDGESALNPLDDLDRLQLSEQMVGQSVAFFPVPLGQPVNPKNLHGLASGTGGVPVRLQANEAPDAVLPRLEAALGGPVLYPSRLTLAGEVTEQLPGKLPPLRADSPTLVVGRMKAMPVLSGTVEGTVAGRPVTVAVKEQVPAPEVDHYFLVALTAQWRNAASKDAPALIRADRALAMAQTQNRIAKDEFLTQAEWALSADQFPAAEKFFEAARRLDPFDPEADTGLKVLERIKSGRLSKDQLRQQIEANRGEAIRFAKQGPEGAAVAQRGKLDALLAQETQPPTPAPPPDAPPGPAAGGNLLQSERQLQIVQEQRARQTVDQAIRQARNLLPRDPEAALDLLKTQLGSVRENIDLGTAVRTALTAELEGTLRDMTGRAAQVRRQLDEQLAARARLEQTRAAAAVAASLEERTRERIRAFSALMAQARYDEAYREALAMTQDSIAAGTPVPVQATAAYTISLNAANLREYRELKRLKEERYLQTMLQVDKSSVPYPDEPPVHFPPATVWRQLTEARKSYTSSGLGADQMTAKTIEIRNKLNKPITNEREIRAALSTVLEFIADKGEVPIIMDLEAFKAQPGAPMEPEQQEVRLQKLNGVTVGTALRLVLGQIGATYIVRGDHIEVTTGRAALQDKAVRVYPVADLVIPIPNAINQQALQQNLQVLGQTFSFGSAGSPLNAFGNVGLAGGLGALGLGALGVGALGVGALGLGGIGGIGGLGGLAIQGIGVAGIAGQLGAAALGAQANGFGGNLGFMPGGGVQNLGVGGGITGIGGGQLGQFGNLGGQFGLQGGDQSGILIKLITDTIARGEWALPTGYTNIPVGPSNPGVGGANDEDTVLQPIELNSLGYYPPSRALVVRATSRLHSNLSGGKLNLGGPPPGAGQAAADKPRDGQLVFGPGAPRRPKPGEGGDQVAKAKPAEAAPKKPDAVAKADKPAANPKELWRDFAKGGLPEQLADKRGPVKDPGLFIAGADFMVQCKKFDHGAELLKAGLREGTLADGWAFDALAIALQGAGASPEEVERAKLSVIDLAPKNPNAYLQAAEGLTELGKADQALALCKRAAALEPSLADPYARAMACAEKLTTVDSDTVVWAADNILRRDWAAESEDRHRLAREKLTVLIKRFGDQNRPADAARLRELLERDSVRDLVVELSWEGPADLDLSVDEPIGTVCSHQQRQSPAGGLLRGDDLRAQRETYTAAEAFPGSYVVKVKRVWGRPLGGKATLKVTRHAGTPEQTQELHTLEFTGPEVAEKVVLESGRRTTAAMVPPARRRAPADAAPAGPDSMFNQLRALADPSLTPCYNGNLAPPVLSASAAQRPVAAADPMGDVGVAAQGRVDGLGGADLAARIEVTVDPKTKEKGIRFVAQPVWQTADRLKPDTAAVNFELIPGGK
jgi:tetratricopeptide (TPR) repeat protein